MSGDETVAFSEALNYTLNLAYKENWEMRYALPRQERVP